METLNRRAMQLDGGALPGAIREAQEKKREVCAQRDRQYGEGRAKISSYLENIALPDVFGFDMNDYYRDPELAMDIDLRHTLFWLDNSRDDGIGGLGANAEIMYYDMTLFGLVIDHQKDGVPIFRRHALEDDPDLSVLKPFDFETTGLMPTVLARYHAFSRMSEERFGGELSLGFPIFHRGPLDIAMQLRGYENFIGDCAEDPAYVHRLLDYIISERLRFNKLAAPFRPKREGRRTSYVADDWVNVPFISPEMFSEFIVPAYRRIQDAEGTVTGFHTCGLILPIVDKLLEVFPGIRTLEVSHWNDLEALDKLVDPNIGFHHQTIPSFTLFAPPEEQDAKIAAMARVRKHRRVSLGVAAIIRMHDTLDETIAAMNSFIDRAREGLAD